MSTALVPVAIPVAMTNSLAHPGSPSGRPRADFLAQLIATVAQAPQTRTRRRAEPAEAVAAYGEIERRPAPQRHAFSRSL